MLVSIVSTSYCSVVTTELEGLPGLAIDIIGSGQSRIMKREKPVHGSPNGLVQRAPAGQRVTLVDLDSALREALEGEGTTHGSSTKVFSPLLILPARARSRPGPARGAQPRSRIYCPSELPLECSASNDPLWLPVEPNRSRELPRRHQSPLDLSDKGLGDIHRWGRTGAAFCEDNVIERRTCG